MVPGQEPAAGLAPYQTGGETGAVLPEPEKQIASILSTPPPPDPAQWQAFHSREGYDATNAAGILCSGAMSGAGSPMAMGQRIPLACSDGTIATLQVTELTPRGARGLMTLDNLQQPASITDSAAP